MKPITPLTRWVLVRTKTGKIVDDDMGIVLFLRWKDANACHSNPMWSRDRYHIAKVRIEEVKP